LIRQTRIGINQSGFDLKGNLPILDIVPVDDETDVKSCCPNGFDAA